MNSEVFEKEIARIMEEARLVGESYVDIKAGDVHRKVGGYPSKNHRMPVCCEVMYSLKKPKDEIISAPPKGKGQA